MSPQVLSNKDKLKIIRILHEIVLSSSSSSRRGSSTTSGNGSNPVAIFVKGALLILALYLGNRYILQSALQWYRRPKVSTYW